MSFVHLHVHSYYSFSKGLASPAELAQAALEREMPALALTDQDSLAGMVEHVKACRERGLRPIIGAELSLHWPAPGAEPPRVRHITVLAESETGYRSLSRLLSVAGRALARGVPALSFAEFAHGAAGLTVLTGCENGLLLDAALSKRIEPAIERLQDLVRAVGRDHVYIEIQPPEDASGDAANRRLLDLADYLGLPAVATQNVHYIAKADHLGAFALAGFGSPEEADWPTWARKRRRRFVSSAEMAALFGWRPELLENTLAIARRCRFQSPAPRQRFPVHALSHGDEAEERLWERVLAGARLESSGGEAAARGRERLDREIGALRQAGLASHILFLADLIADLDKGGIARGPARGLWARSMAAFALGIAPLNPGAYHLPEPDWSRLGESLPLLRLDLAEDDLPRVRAIFDRRVGEARWGLCARHPLWRRPSVIRRLCQWAGASEAKMTRLLAERPPRRDAREAGKSGNGNGSSLDEQLKIDDSYFLRRAADLLADRPTEARFDSRIYAFAGMDLEDVAPVTDLPGGGLGILMDPDALDHLGLPRVQLASSPLMDVLALTVQRVRQQGREGFTLQSIPLNDAEAYGLLASGQTTGIADLNSIAAKTLLRAAPPTSLLELAAILIRRTDAPEQAFDGDQRITAALPDALMAYWAAWLKHWRPEAFMSAMLTRSLPTPRRFAILLRETRRMRIPLLPPDINLSELGFAPERGAIRTGLGLIRQFGQRAYAELERERKARPFDDLVDFCRRTDPRIINQRAIANLIKAGAFDRFQQPRSHQIALLDEIFRDVRLERDAAEETGQLTLFDLDELELKQPGSGVRLHDLGEFSAEERRVLETEATGFPLSVDPFERYKPIISALNARAPDELRRRDLNREVFVAGYIDHVEPHGLPGDDDPAPILDLEGLAVRVPKGARSWLNGNLECAGPALVGGVARRHRDDMFLEAGVLFSLDDVADVAARVAEIVLDVRGEDAQTLKWIAGAIKPHPGNARLRLQGADEPLATAVGRLESLGVLFCPPVYLNLLQILPEKRLLLRDAEGRPIEMPRPRLIQ